MGYPEHPQTGGTGSLAHAAQEAYSQQLERDAVPALRPPYTGGPIGHGRPILATRPEGGNLLGQQIERIQAITRHLAECTQRLDSQLSTVIGAEPRPAGENGKAFDPGCHLDALAGSINQLEAVVAYVHQQVERAERL